MAQERKQQVSVAKIRKVFAFLQSQSTLVLSTRDAGGAVHSAPLFYLVEENLDLFWLSSEKSMHSRDLLVEPHVSLAGFRSTFEWREIAGVQMHGLCSVVEGAERAPILDAYRARFQLGAVLNFAVSRSLVYRFRPQWIRYIDNQKRFGYKFELVL